MPGVNDDVQRHARLRITYRDLDGNMQIEEPEGLRAVCHQHEIDQLERNVLDQAIVPPEAGAADQAVREAVTAMKIFSVTLSGPPRPVRPMRALPAG